MADTPLRDLADKLKEDPAYASKFSVDPVGELNKAARESEPAYLGDRAIYRIVVLALALVLLTAAVGAIVLGWNGKAMPESLIALGSAAIGALAGLLAPSPVRGGQG
jgi:hypothetical protein